jgi:hypothetical protein
MLLRELIDFTPVKSNRDFITHSRRIRTATKPEHKGTGSFGMAYNMNSPKRLNQITKLGRAAAMPDGALIPTDKISDDGYLSWLQEVNHRAKIGDVNPYLPIIHDLKIMKGPDDKLHYRVNMEDLVTFTSKMILGNEPVMSSLCMRMFGKDLDESVKNDPKASEFLYAYYGDFIILRLSRGVRNPNDFIKDAKLKQVLDAISFLRNNNNDFMVDLHEGNIMWRMTGTIPQLVILDPLA